MSIRKEQVTSVMNLDPELRYQHTIKEIVAYESVWILTSTLDQTWAYMSTDKQEVLSLAIWPHAEYAETCIKDKFASYESTEIPLDRFMKEILPLIRDDGDEFCVCMNDTYTAQLCDATYLSNDLKSEINSILASYDENQDDYFVIDKE
tara:strand:- start:979 stop:1425 length:447 start_codon:yes stop_codon:yes gene_type:complete